MKILAALCLILFVACAAFAQSVAPELVFRGSEAVETTAGKRILYRLGVTNRLAYPNELFEAAPDLPPCGRNRNSSRTWVNIYLKNGKRLYGFCVLKSAEELDALSFTYPAGKVPNGVYIVIWDRQTGIEYKSNTIEVE